MIKRNIIKYLREWRRELDIKEGGRKPLIVRGARQVGKTYTIQEFGLSDFKDLVMLNLDKDSDRAFFKEVQSASALIKTIELGVRRKICPGETLLFLDEIQESEVAIKELRYLAEEMPNLHVIAAGSLLDVYLNRKRIEVPVGRIEYCHMHPLTFDEFLLANGNEFMLDALSKLTMESAVTDVEHALYHKAFLEYLLIGGMPEVVARYVSGESPQAIERVYESLMIGYRDDIGKYASPSQSIYLRHCLENAPRSVGMQISYNHFAESDFRSREISGAFDTLEAASLVTRVFSSRSLSSPLVQNRKKSPKIIFLDMGLVNYKLGKRDKIVTLSALENVFQGQLSEQVVGQAFRAFGLSSEYPLAYWYRDKKNSSAEVDYLLTNNERIYPVEVKAGSSQRLQSLAYCVDERVKAGVDGADLAVRVYSGKPNRESLKTRSGNSFVLVSVPYYLAFRTREILSPG